MYKRQSYVLYPGNVHKLFKEDNDLIIPSVGAFPLAPGNGGEEEYRYVEMYPVFYKDELPRDVTQQRYENSMSGSLYRIRTVIKWCIKRGLTRNNPFDQYQMCIRDSLHALQQSGKTTGMAGLCRSGW